MAAAADLPEVFGSPGDEPPDGTDPAGRQAGLRLEYATTAWNVLEVVVTVSLGLSAGSLALVAFGLDSSIEVFASLVVIWHMRGDAGGSDHRRARRSRRALRLMAAAFVILGLYLATNAVYAIVNANEPSTSPIGATFMAATVVVMFVLATAKRRVGRRLGNRPLLGNARMTFLDGCLAAGVCSALVADLALGWWWLDPVAAAVVAVLATGEGIKGWNEAADVTR
ncbi:MAG: hypothetical protein V7605_2090 [Acidimicrobiaceae bacterium]|jgi:divalent metal cation (Fe/Co/Zn/Cd) transporter